MTSAFFTGLAGQDLSPDERQFLRATQPAGIILFARNIGEPDQVRRLIAEARTAIGGDNVLVLIDQEGGRVQRLRPPHWRALPEAARYRHVPSSAAAPTPAAAARAIAELTASDLRALGITCNCAPVLDLPVAGSHDVIGNRAYGHSIDDVVALAEAVMAGYAAGGVLPVIKHTPGHGRATADSHLHLPVVTASRATLEATDFVPFKRLNTAPAAMTAHVVFTAIDPREPASTSALVHREVIRGHIGFDGLLMSDDLSMQALAGASLRARAEAVLAAGTDIALHCNGVLAEMHEVASGVGPLIGRAQARFTAAFAVTQRAQPFDRLAAEATLAEVLRATV